MTTDYIASTLDCLAYAILYEPWAAGDATLAADTARLLLRLHEASSTKVSDDLRERIAQLALVNHDRTRGDKFAKNLALSNPEMFSLSEIRKTYAADLSRFWAPNVRSIERRAAMDKQLILAENMQSGRRSIPEPIHLKLGMYYSEMTDPFLPYVHEHANSELYVFHAFAWGRRNYAAYLESIYYSACPLSTLTVADLRRDNPDDGSGIAYLRLACEYVWRSDLPLFTLPIPGRGINAHDFYDGALYQTRTNGAPRDAVKTFLHDELAKHGLTEADIRT